MEKPKTLVFRCSCGYIIEIFIDFGEPGETIICTKCGKEIKRDKS